MNAPGDAIAGTPQNGAANAYAPLREKIRALSEPGAWQEPARRIEVIETHFACVFLTDAHAYKLKKPVRTAFLDLTSLAARHFNCSEELRLNARLAPRIYLGLTALTREADGSLRAGGSGDVVDWLVRMRRLPAGLMLDHAIADDTVRREALQAVGELLAGFYEKQQRMPFEPHVYVSRLAAQAHEDRTALLAPDLELAPPRVESTVGVQLGALRRLENEACARAAQRRIVEAHGDLRPEHIYLGDATDPPCVIDSLEFSKDLRTLDPAEELAFLCVECERIGAAWAGQAVFEAYRARSGDPVSPALLDLYRSRRAMARAKITAWHLRDPEVSGRAPWRRLAEDYLQASREYAERATRLSVDS